MPDQLEVEVKFAVSDLESMRAKLASLDALSHGKHHEMNVRLDNATGSLMRRDITLRVRNTRLNGHVERIVTVKTPAANRGVSVRVRREIEFTVSDDEAVIAAFEALGYRPVWRYEKRREYYSLGDVEVSLDETPIGPFVELEGTAEAIADAAGKLSLHMGDGIVDSYAILFQYAREQLEFDAVDMTFDALSAVRVTPELFEPFSQRQRLSAWISSQEE